MSAKGVEAEAEAATAQTRREAGSDCTAPAAADDAAAVAGDDDSDNEAVGEDEDEEEEEVGGRSAPAPAPRLRRAAPGSWSGPVGRGGPWWPSSVACSPKGTRGTGDGRVAASPATSVGLAWAAGAAAMTTLMRSSAVEGERDEAEAEAAVAGKSQKWTGKTHPSVERTGWAMSPPAPE